MATQSEREAQSSELGTTEQIIPPPSEAPDENSREQGKVIDSVVNLHVMYSNSWLFKLCIAGDIG